MSEKHDRKDIENYEEAWQKRYYFLSGDGVHYIHVCELCWNTCAERIPGGHYLCFSCKKKLRLLNEKTIIRNGKRFLKNVESLRLEDRFKGKHHPADAAKEERKEAWRRVIISDYLIEIINKHFKYDKL